MPDNQEFNDELDYMHPDGKPEENKGQEIKEGEAAIPDAKSMQKALDDADGHSIKKPDKFLDS
jgi:hypothetical protein